MSLFDDAPAFEPAPALALPARGDAANVARQLRIVQKLFGYKYGRTDAETETLTVALANALAENGISDIREFGIETHNILDSWPDSGPVYAHRPVWVNRKTGARFMECQLSAPPTLFDDPPQRLECYEITDSKKIDLPNRYYVIFTAKITDGGVPYFIPEFKRRSSLSEDLRFIAGFLLVAVPGVNAVLAPAIFGSSFVAAYPAVASIATNVAVNTALSGGDVESAVKSALSSFAGGAFGGQVGAALNSDLAAKLTSAATAAALQGGDVQNAVQSALIRHGAGAAGDFVSDMVELAQPAPAGPVFDIDLEAQAAQSVTPEGAAMNDFEFGFDDAFSGPFDFGLSDGVLGSQFDQTQGFDMAFLDTFDSSGVIAPEDYADADFDYGGGFIAPADFADADFDYGPGVSLPSMPDLIAAEDYADADFDYGPGVSAPNPAAPTVTGGYTFSQGIKDVSSLAMAAIQISAAYDRSRNPAPVPAGTRTSTRGNTVTGQTNGMVTVRTPTGGVQAQRPPAGVPYGTAEGGVIVNNGDGTYTYSNAAGAVVTRAYDSNASKIDGKTVAMIAAGLGAVLLLSRR